MWGRCWKWFTPPAGCCFWCHVFNSIRMERLLQRCPCRRVTSATSVAGTCWSFTSSPGEQLPAWARETAPDKSMWAAPVISFYCSFIRKSVKVMVICGTIRLSGVSMGSPSIKGVDDCFVVGKKSFRQQLCSYPKIVFGLDPCPTSPPPGGGDNRWNI